MNIAPSCRDPRSHASALIRGLCVLIVFLNLIAAAGAQPAPPSRDAGVGVWPWLVGNIDASVPSIIQQATITGLDTLYLHLYRTTGPGNGTLHALDEGGDWNPAWGSLDPDVTLSNFISQAHAAGLQVVGVVNCFLSGGPLPGNASHEALLLDVVDWLVHSRLPGGQPRYALDGIALDRVRFYDGLTNPHQPVTDFVQQVKDRIGLLPLHGYLPANLWHIDGPPYNGSFRTYGSAMSLLQQQYGQHWENLAQVFDVFLPMAYIAEGGLYGSNTALMQAYLETVAGHAVSARTTAGAFDLRVLPAVRAWNDATGTTTAASLGACINGALLGGAEGFMNFRYFTSAGQTSWWNATANHVQPGPDLPLASFALTGLQGQTATLDAGSSTLGNPLAGPLEARFDLDDDGTADTPWSANLAVPFLVPAPGSWSVTVEVRDQLGARSVRNRAITFGGSALTFGPGSLSASGGGQVPVHLDLGPAATGLGYVIAASASGTSPGTVLSPTLTVPLNADPLTDIVLLLANSPILPGFAGLLTSSGTATAAMNVPPGALSGLAWQTLHFAAVGLDPSGLEFRFATDAESFLILP